MRGTIPGGGRHHATQRAALDFASRRPVRRPRGLRHLHRRHRPGAADAVPHRRCRHRDRGRDRPRRVRSLGHAHRPPAIGVRRSAPRRGVAAQRALHEAGRGRGLHAPQLHHGRLSHQGRPLELPALQFPQPSRRRTERAGRGGGSRRGGEGRAELERARPGGGDHRRQGRRRHGAHARRMGAASASRRHRRAAAAGSDPHRRRAGGTVCRRASARCQAFACWT